MSQSKYYLYFLIFIFSIQISAQNDDHRISSQLKLINNDFLNNSSFLQDNFHRFTKQNKLADSTIRMDSIITFSDNGALEKHLFQYNQNSKFTEWLTIRNDSSGWHNTTKMIRLYDNNNNLETQLYYGWFEDDWFALSQFNYIYDPEGNLIQRIMKTNSNNSWLNYGRSTYIYDTLGNHNSTVNENWINEEWQNRRLSFIYYSDLSNIDSVVFLIWQDDQWNNHEKSIFNYDGPNYLLDSYTYFVWNGTNWINYSRRYSIEYPISREAEVIKQVWSDENWLNTEKTIYSFNEFDFIEEAENNVWENGNWIIGNSVILFENHAGFHAGLISNKVEAYYSNVATSINENNISPDNFTLSQNYPNPFNPATTIQFSIPKSDFVTLKIYDLLGKEIQTLINDYKPQGVHEVTFDGSDLASGTFFYQLKAGNSIDTKKFILLK